MEEDVRTTDPEADTEAGPVIPAATERSGGADSEPVVVRRHAGLSALIGIGAGLLAGLYLVRAVDQGGTLSWTVGAALAALAIFHLTQWADARTPLLVADPTGVRLRLGNAWHGLLWDDVSRVTVRLRRGWFRDGLVVVHPVDESTLQGLGGRSGRRLAANTKMYGAPFAIPLGLTTVSSTDDLAGALEALASAETAVQITGTTEEQARDGEPEGHAAVPSEEPRTFDGSHSDGPHSDGPHSDEPEAAQGFDPAHDDNPEAAYRPVPESADSAQRDPADGPGQEPEPTAAREPRPRPEPQPHPEPTPTPEPAPSPDAGPSPEHERTEYHGRQPQHVAEHHEHPGPADASAAPAPPESPEPLEPPQLVRPVRRALRSDVVRPPTVRAPIVGQLALQEPMPEDTDAATSGSDRTDDRSDSSTDAADDRYDVRPRRSRPRGNMSLVLGDTPIPAPAEAEAEPEPEPEPEPEVVPVIGPEITEARRVLGLSVDDLASRTRIRPHVIEAIEVDDFGACAGDFYARGHLRALARVLGIDAEPLLTRFEERYATAPINARKVFEAELAAGDAGAIRGVGSHGGPRWGGLVALVLALLLVWALAGVFLDGAGESTSGAPAHPGASAPLQPDSGGP